ncbi:putative methyltransferase [Leishmania major strain Friedlin]|uniref:Putative methyltransferase n=1 Tax=Leishmania major TaxID=5664 RepID=Q4QDT1_LEIMA|nr:putative methyltransferase [Leishmania major strain Friedlin]CAG9572497.1 Multisite-specific_tRNA:(cytosine-C(5))-methyltransferase_-_putative [Leishmania major strain Friedlin]CAJ03980.1 putative methyltransferase [Leishmania major strain Friedlin]|eukprot:XP_001682517.1 putative methyltransferase [Leishmania major strain Friedlin]
MKRREQRRQREREQLPTALTKLVQLIPSDEDARRYLAREFADITQDEAGSNAPCSAEGSGHDAGAGDAWIYGSGLEKLLSVLGEEACPDGAFDIVRITRRVPRSQSTIDRINVAELCFAVSQASGPVDVHERRRTAGATSGPLDETIPLLQYYRGSRFDAIVRGEDPSSPAARHAAADAALLEENSSHLEIASAGNGSRKNVDSEWPAFVQSMSTPLPMTLRLHHSERALEAIATRMLTTPDIAAVVRPVTAFPSSAGLYSCSNSDYHSHKRVEYVCRTLHAASAVSFQEVVSAIPVFVLDVQPQHTVVDLCAAPGSKTVQALDTMLSGGWSADVCRGVLIANEKDRVKATQTLPARLKRYHAPNVMTTRCDGVQWPRLYFNDPTNPSSEPQERRFDRIICDVPCSGDGTIRKECSIATTWSASYVKSLVPTQRALLCRGLDLLATGGILVYSTCSMNPKEDEEVVCVGLEAFGDSVELIDVNAVLQEKGFHLHSAGGILSPNVEGMQHPVLPPTYDGNKVLRILPHRDDTGGFFVAAFRKAKQPDRTAPTVIRHKLNHWTKGKLWAPVGVEDEAWANISTFYGFDRRDEANFVYYDATSSSSGKGLVPLYHLNPNGGPIRRIVLSTPALADMVLRTRPYKGPGVEVVSVGMRAFEAYDGRFLPTAACRWRAVVESASFLAPRFTARRLHFHVSKHKQLLEDLLRNGHVYTRDHWRTVLGGDPAVVAANANPKALVKPGSRLEALLTQGSSESTISDEEVAVLLTSHVEVGCVLVGILFDEPTDAAAGPWYMSATLSGHKLELAIDGSLRAFGLMTFFGIHDVERGSLAGNNIGSAVADEEPEEQAKEV